MITTSISEQNKIANWLIVATLAVTLDGLTTTYALGWVLGASEVNPIINALINSTSVPTAMSIKMVVGAALAMFFAYCADMGYPFRWMQRNWRLQRVPRAATRKRGLAMLYILTVAHALVVINNIIVIGLNQ